jgi:hypothetical protein
MHNNDEKVVWNLQLTIKAYNSKPTPLKMKKTTTIIISIFSEVDSVYIISWFITSVIVSGLYFKRDLSSQIL